MNTLDAGLVLELIAQSNDAKVWCGESYIQKVSYISKTVLELPLSVPFVLYKRSPYSFELKALLMEMRANRLIMLAPEGSYGPSFVLVDNILTQGLRADVKMHSADIKKIVTHFASKSIADLEAFSTAIMFFALGHGNPERYPDELQRLLPALSRPDATATLEEAHEFLKRDRVPACSC